MKNREKSSKNVKNRKNRKKTQKIGQKSVKIDQKSPFFHLFYQIFDSCKIIFNLFYFYF